MPTPELKRRWFHLSPDRFVTGLLLVIGSLWLSDRFQSFGFNHHKGWTVLIAVAAVGVAAVAMLLWWAASLLFHWRFQFSIRSLLGFCLACSIAVSWFAVEWKDARRQAEAIAAIQNSGGFANYDWQVDDVECYQVTNPEPPAPRWLRNTLGDDFFSTVVDVEYGDTNITDAAIEHLKELTQVRKLNLFNTNITDAGLESITVLARLRELYIPGTKITDAGLEHLKELPQLRNLYLDATKITDVGLEQLEGIAQLRELYLSGTDITDVGVEKLKHSLPNCQISR